MERKVKVTRKVSCQLSKVIKLSAKQFVGVFSEVCLLNSDVTLLSGREERNVIEMLKMKRRLTKGENWRKN